MDKTVKHADDVIVNQPHAIDYADFDRESNNHTEHWNTNGQAVNGFAVRCIMRRKQ